MSIVDKLKNELVEWKKYFFIAFGALVFLAFINGFALASLGLQVNSFYIELLWAAIPAWLAIGGLSIAGDYARRRGDRLGLNGGQNVKDL